MTKSRHIVYHVLQFYCCYYVFYNMKRTYASLHCNFIMPTIKAGVVWTVPHLSYCRPSTHSSGCLHCLPWGGGCSICLHAMHLWHHWLQLKEIMCLRPLLRCRRRKPQSWPFSPFSVFLSDIWEIFSNLLSTKQIDHFGGETVLFVFSWSWKKQVLILLSVI